MLKLIEKYIGPKKDTLSRWWLYITCNQDKFTFFKVAGLCDDIVVSDSVYAELKRMDVKDRFARPPTHLANIHSGVYSSCAELYALTGVSAARLEQVLERFGDDAATYYYASLITSGYSSLSLYPITHEETDCPWPLASLSAIADIADGLEGTMGMVISHATIRNLTDVGIEKGQEPSHSCGYNGDVVEQTSIVFYVSVADPRVTRTFTISDDNGKVVQTFKMSHGSVVLWDPKDNTRFNRSISTGSGRHIVMEFRDVLKDAMTINGQRFIWTPAEGFIIQNEGDASTCDPQDG